MIGRISTWSFYDETTGVFSGHQFTGHESTLGLNAPPGHKAAEGRHDPLSKRIDVETGELVEYQPLQPSQDHVWDDATKRWRLSDHAQAKAAQRAAAVARIAILTESQHQYVRQHCLGDPSALEQLRAIDDEIVNLKMEAP
jgi:hypothetical protein